MVNQGFIELGQKVDLCIPTGNFGNILSAIYAKTMLDVPYDRIICASNDNKVLHDFFSTGIYDLRQRNLIKTISPAIDILISSNLERLLWTHLGAHRVNELMTSLAQDQYFQIKSKELEMILDASNLKTGWCNEEDCKDMMFKTWQDDKYMVDPHTSVALKVAKEFQNHLPMLVTSTAHYSKFVEECKEVLDKVTDTVIEKPMAHQGIALCYSQEVVHHDVIDVNYETVCKKLKDFTKGVFH